MDVEVEVETIEEKVRGRLSRCYSEVVSIYNQRVINNAISEMFNSRSRSSSVSKNTTLQTLTVSGNMLFTYGRAEKHFSSKIPKKVQWEKKWCRLDKDQLMVFENENETACEHTICLTTVASLRTVDDGGKNLTFNVLVCKEKTDMYYMFQTSDIEERQWWLFNFQRSIAHIITKARTSSKKAHSWIGTSNKRMSKSQLKGKHVVVVSAGNNGRKSYMEDIFVAIEDLNSVYQLEDCPHQAFCAVYDGHCGDEAAAFCSKTIHEYMLQHTQFNTNIEAAFISAFQQVEDEFLEWANNPDVQAMSGTTAIAAFIRGKELFIANLGDCRAVLCDGNGKAVELSVDHRPSRPEEVKRIEEMGAWVVKEEVLNIPKLYQLGLEEMEEMEEAEELVGWVTIERVCGVLQMTRSIGDRLIKGKQKSEFFETEFSGEFIVPTPEITQYTIARDDQYVILASDGVWDVLSSQEVVDFISMRLSLGVGLEEVAEMLMEACFELGGLDNMSCVIAFFEPQKRLKYPWKADSLSPPLCESFFSPPT